MRVAIFTDKDFENDNGVTTTLRAVLDHAPDDLDLRIYTSDSVGIASAEYLSLPAPGVGIPFHSEMKIYWPTFRRFLRHATADGVEVVHVTTPGPMGLAGIWVASRLGVRVVGSFHTDLAEYARLLSGSSLLGRAAEQYLRWVYGKCERVFAPSQATRALLVRAGLEEPKIEIWKRGVSTTLFDPARRSVSLRQSWGVSSARPALLYVGRLSREKNLAMIPRMSQHLRYAGVKHRVVFVGDGPMRKELESTSPEAVFTGTLAPDAVAVAMASADLFVFPSQTDTAGNVVLEAQASSLPVLVSSVGGPRENLLPDESGYICGGLIDFARRAAELVRSPVKRQQFGTAARTYALTRRWENALTPLYRTYLTQPHAITAPSAGVDAASALRMPATLL